MLNGEMFPLEAGVFDMARRSLLVWFLPLVAIIGASVPSDALAQVPLSMIAEIAAKPAAPASQPAATQPASAGVATAQVGDDEIVPKEWSQLDLIKVFKGEKHLTAQQIFQLGYWLDFGKDFVFGILKFIPRLFVAAFLFAVFWVIYRCVRKLIVGGMTKAGVDSSIRDMLGSLLKWGILGFGLVIAGNQIGIQIAALLTGVSIIGLSVGFAAQTTLANFIAGIVIFWDKPFKIGDWVEIEGQFAQVRRVTFRSTRLRNKSGEMAVFANTIMLSTKLLNHTTEPLNRVTVPVKFPWSESVESCRETLLGLIRNDQRVCSKPRPTVEVESLGDNCVNMLLHFWVSDESIVYDIRSAYLEKAKNALDAMRIRSTAATEVNVTLAAAA